MNTPTLLASRSRITGLVAVLAVALFFILSASAYAAPASGWIWGGTESSDGAYDGMGWFSVNSTDSGAGGRSYSVDIPYTDGDISGYAWSEHYGWLSFDTGGCAGKGAARRVGNNIVGAAEILASRGVGGFDGCVVFDHGRSNEVTINPATGELSGYAWSSDLGWLDFCQTPGASRCVSIPSVGTPFVTLGDNSCTIPSGGTQCSPVLPYTTNGDVVSGEIKDAGGLTVRSIGPNQNATYAVSPALVGEQTVTYTITGRNAAGTEVSDTGTVRSQCTTGEAWVSGRCQVPAISSGEITARNQSEVVSNTCYIATGSDTCILHLDWYVSTAVTEGVLENQTTSVEIARGNPLQTSPQRNSVTLTYGSQTYALYDDTSTGLNQLRTRTVFASCSDPAASPEAGTGICRVPASAAGTLTASPNPCIIPLGSDSCTTGVSWSSAAFSEIPNVYVDEGAGENIFDPGTALNDSNTLSYTFPNGPSGVTFTLYEGNNASGTPQGTETVQATCGTNVWDAGEGKCVDPNGLQSISLTCDTSPCECTVADGASTCSSGIQFTTTVTGDYTDARTFDQNTGNSVPGSDGLGTSPWSFTFNPVIGATNGPVEYVASANGSDPITGLPTSVSSNPPVQVLVSCASGREPAGGVCPSTAVSGELSLSASSCTILDGDGACTVDLSWTTTNVGANDVQITKSPTSWSLDAQSANGSHLNKPMAPENDGDPSTTYTFHLREQSTGVILDTETFTASCESGSEWDGDSCEPPVTDDITVTPQSATGVDCPIQQGDSTCDARVVWTLSGANPEVQIDGTVEWTGATGDQTKAFNRGTYDIEARANGALVDSELNYEVDCDAGLVYDVVNSLCLGAPMGTVNFTPEGESSYTDLQDGLDDCLIEEDQTTCTTNITYTTDTASQPYLYVMDGASQVLVDDFYDGDVTRTGKSHTHQDHVLTYGSHFFKLVDDAGAGNDIELEVSNQNVSGSPELVEFKVGCADGLSPDYSAAPTIYCRDFSGPQ